LATSAICSSQIAWLKAATPSCCARRAPLLGKVERALQSALQEWHAQTLPRLLDAGCPAGKAVGP